MIPPEYQVPSLLYKYLHPDRIDVLTGGRIRFSQRWVFPDDHELKPDYATFGTVEEIRCFVGSLVRNPSVQFTPPFGMSEEELVQRVASDPTHQDRMKVLALSSIKSIDEMGVLCLSENRNVERMWAEYAGNGRGFVIAFDTTHTDFAQLHTPGSLRKVEYSDAPIGTVLSALKTEGEGLFRKRMSYAFEAEWRSIRLLKRLEDHSNDLFLAPFSPATIREIIIRPGCIQESFLHNLIATDPRYAHVQITVQSAN